MTLMELKRSLDNMLDAGVDEGCVVLVATDKDTAEDASFAHISGIDICGDSNTNCVRIFLAEPVVKEGTNTSVSQELDDRDEEKVIEAKKTNATIYSITEGECPNCKRFIQCPAGEMNSYCPICGQRLRWVHNVYSFKKFRALKERWRLSVPKLSAKSGVKEYFIRKMMADESGVPMSSIEAVAEALLARPEELYDVVRTDLARRNK